jgi:hypothetical protein
MRETEDLPAPEGPSTAITFAICIYLLEKTGKNYIKIKPSPAMTPAG